MHSLTRSVLQGGGAVACLLATASAALAAPPDDKYYRDLARVNGVFKCTQELPLGSPVGCNLGAGPQPFRTFVTPMDGRAYCIGVRRPPTRRYPAGQRLTYLDVNYESGAGMTKRVKRSRCNEASQRNI